MKQVTYTLTANAQLFPRSFNGGTANNIYLTVANLGTPSGQGLDFINGYAFLERFYSVFDTGKLDLPLLLSQRRLPIRCTMVGFFLLLSSWVREFQRYGSEVV